MTRVKNCLQVQELFECNVRLTGQESESIVTADSTCNKSANSSADRTDITASSDITDSETVKQHQKSMETDVKEQGDERCEDPVKETSEKRLESEQSAGTVDSEGSKTEGEAVEVAKSRKKSKERSSSGGAASSDVECGTAGLLAGNRLVLPLCFILTFKPRCAVR